MLALLSALLTASPSALLTSPRAAPLIARYHARPSAASRASSLFLAERELMSNELMEEFGGCAPNDEPLGWKGALLATAATYLWYLGTNTKTNREREEVEEPGVRRRAILLVILLQLGAANFRSGTDVACTPEERLDRNKRVLERKGFAVD